MDGFGLPANVLRCLLDGFAHATNESFKQLCVTLSTMNRSNLMQNNQGNKTIKQKCFDVLKDLEMTYIDLSASQRCKGVGRNESTAFPAYRENDAYAAMAA